MATNWEIAKVLLKEDWCAGMIPLTMGPSEVHIFRLEYEAVPHQNFSVNLNALRKKLDSQQKTAASDDAALAKDVELHPINMNPVGRPYPRWDGSDAQRLLKQDVALEKHKTMTPRALRMTSVEHQRFPKEVFAKHIHQVIRTLRETPHWLVKKQKQQEKKEKAAAKKLAAAAAAAAAAAN
jgi:hypothetical protein